MNVSPTGRPRKGLKSVPVRFSFTVTVLFLTIGPMPPSRSNALPMDAFTWRPYVLHSTIATFSEDTFDGPGSRTSSAYNNDSPTRQPNGAAAAKVKPWRKNCLLDAGPVIILCFAE